MYFTHHCYLQEWVLSYVNSLDEVLKSAIRFLMEKGKHAEVPLYWMECDLSAKFFWNVGV